MQRAPLFFGAVLLVETVAIIYTQRNNLPVTATPSATFGTPSSVGEILFNQYLLPFEVTSILLLVAMIGAIVLSKPRT
jgi:NADH-quinone oxidoreductase subunit J